MKNTTQNKRSFWIPLLIFLSGFSSYSLAEEMNIASKPVTTIVNPCSKYSLINSVDFHPCQNLFCVTYTHGNRIDLYEISISGNISLVQTLINPKAKFSEPQHAIFSADGNAIVVANWSNQSLTFYNKINNSYSTSPSNTLHRLHLPANYKPHGITTSPCGNFLAIAYGAASYYGKAIALFQNKENNEDFKLVNLLKTSHLPGIPKGISFSPDGNCLLVTFSDDNSLVIYDLNKFENKILPTPRQTIKGLETKISRPEDVKISPDGKFCALSNSDQNSVTFYPFDSKLNRVTQTLPCRVMNAPEFELCFPHGLAFSPDGAYLVITEFGPIDTTLDGDLFWDDKTMPNWSKINVYKILK